MEPRKLSARIMLVIVVLIVLFSVAWTKNQQTKQTTWEYKHIDLSSSVQHEYDKTLNQQGSEGWELTAVEREQPGGRVHFYLKRAK